MPQIVISSLFNKALTLDPGCSNVLSGLQSHYIDWMHACGGKGRCTTCKMIIIKGLDNFSEMTKAETGYRDIGLLKADERLACQSRLLGDAVIKIAPENKFPHIKYSD